jgi:hypothetical protein
LVTIAPPIGYDSPPQLVTISPQLVTIQSPKHNKNSVLQVGNIEESIEIRRRD